MRGRLEEVGQRDKGGEKGMGKDGERKYRESEKRGEEAQFFLF